MLGLTPESLFGGLLNQFSRGLLSPSGSCVVTSNEPIFLNLPVL